MAWLSWRASRVNGPMRSSGGGSRRSSTSAIAAPAGATPRPATAPASSSRSPTRSSAARRGWTSPLPTSYGVGMVFLPTDADERRRCEQIVERSCEDEGLRLLGWRDVPHDPSAIGHVSRAGMPAIRQFFVAAVGVHGDVLERRLYVLRRVIERHRDEAPPTGDGLFYICSLSCRTVVYKGMLMAQQIAPFFPDLVDHSVVSALALVHSRFSTNVLPRWDIAQPFRYSAHNGEINTLRGNVNWMRARQSKFKSALYGADIDKLRPVIDEFGSGLRAVRQRPRAARAHRAAGAPRDHDDDPRGVAPEPRDGRGAARLLRVPRRAARAMGRPGGDRLHRRPGDRCHPRPQRAAAGAVHRHRRRAGGDGVRGRRARPPRGAIVRKWRLEPGKILLVDTEAGRIVDDAAAKAELAGAHPYRDWIRQGTVYLHELEDTEHPSSPTPAPCSSASRPSATPRRTSSSCWRR